MLDERVAGFPFGDPPVGEDGKTTQEYSRLLHKIGHKLIDGYKVAHEDIADLLAGTEEYQTLCHGLAHTLANDYWELLTEAGLSHRSPLHDRILDHMMVWMGIASWQAFLVGKVVGMKDAATTSLDALLKDVDLGGEVDGLG